jgi:hypothetical protein
MPPSHRLRPVLAVLVAAVGLAAAPALAKTPPKPAKAPKDACAAPHDISLARGVEIIAVQRAYKGADGESHIETIKLSGETKSFYGGSIKLTQYDLGNPTRVMLVYGYPNMTIAKHPSPYREMFLLLSGSSTITLADGSTHERGPGSLLIVDDQGTPGRSGRTGPCGYVALDLQFKDAPPAKEGPTPAQ